MTDRELFEEVLKRFEEQYRLRIDRPYSDGYFELVDEGGNNLGGMNSDGYNLLFNLSRLCALLKDELL